MLTVNPPSPTGSGRGLPTCTRRAFTPSSAATRLASRRFVGPLRIAARVASSSWAAPPGFLNRLTLVLSRAKPELRLSLKLR
jgi:hypothetical protein